MVRVAQIINRMDYGGIESVVVNYYRHIDHSRFQFDFYVTEDSLLPQLRELEDMGAKVYRIPPYSHVISYHRCLKKAFKDRGYQIVHAHLSTMSLFALYAAKRAGVPVRICHNHSTAQWGEGVKTLLKYMLRPWNQLFATDYFACGDHAAGWMYGKHKLQSAKVSVWPNAIEVDKFTFHDMVRESVRKELGIPMDAFVVGHIGRFTYPKNHPFLIRIFEEVVRQEKNAYLLLVGEGECEPEVKELVGQMEDSHKVLMVGSRSDCDRLYSAMDVFCLPSFYEGMPVVAWEAQANGLPIVMSTAVSHEAGVNDNAIYMSLDEAAGQWANQLLKMQRIPVETAGKKVPNISVYAAKLQQYYEERLKDIS